MTGDAAFVERVFELDGRALTCRFHQPDLAPGGEYRCGLEILWPEGPMRRSVPGIDGIQALLLAMRSVHTELVNSDAYKAGRLSYLGESDLGLPPPYEFED